MKESPTSRVSHATDPGAAVPDGPSRLLVLGHDDAERDALFALLGEQGYHVASAGDVDDGLRMTRDFRPELVVCEWQRRRLDGPAYCRSVKSDPALRATHITMLCANEDASSRVEGLDAGADDVLVRPFEPDELSARVRAGLRVRRQLRELCVDQHRTALIELAATLGHEINNPLTALFGHMELVLHYPEQGDSYRMQHHIREAGNVAARIGKVAQRLTEMVEPRTTTYLGHLRMLDL